MTASPAPTARRNLVVLGGSSAFTPLLMDALAAIAGRLPPLQIALVGRDAARSDAVARFVRLRNARRADPPDHTIVATGDAAAALRSADIVVNQIRVGGFAGRSHDETFPLAFGLPGDETIGPAGLASALRSVPVFDELARLVPPGVTWVHMSNPLGIGLRALLEPDAPGRAPLRAFGLCELPEVTLRRACARIGVDPAVVTARYVGANHQGAFVAVLDEREHDVLPAILRAIDASEAPGGPAEFGVEGRRLRELGVLALAYRRLYEHRARSVAAQRARTLDRGRELQALADRLLAHYASTSSAELPAPLAARPMPWNELALVPAIESLLDGQPRRLAVSRPAASCLPGVPGEAVVEHFGVQHPTAAAPPAPGPLDLDRPSIARELELTRRIARFEQLALRAAREPNTTHVVECLAAHPFDLAADTCRELAPSILRCARAGAIR
ncbi:MAG: hypothetical protein IPM29_17900 [Planctomycetes bacterium]|nr:hypothetical protein [Planctomycetota bacterium]